MNNFLELLPALLPEATRFVEGVEATILAKGTALNSRQIADARAAGVKHPEKIRIMVAAKMPAPTNPALLQAGQATGLLSPLTGGTAFRYGIFVRSDCQNDRTLLVHECAHTAQYERLGGIQQFLAAYLSQCLTDGYPDAALEQEAIQVAHAIVQS